MKDVAGRIQRQAGEWTGDPKKQAKGPAKQVEGKLQNARGKAKDAAKKEADSIEKSSKSPHSTRDTMDSDEVPAKFGAPADSGNNFLLCSIQGDRLPAVHPAFLF